MAWDNNALYITVCDDHGSFWHIYDYKAGVLYVYGFAGNILAHADYAIW